MAYSDPVARLARTQREFGEYGGVNASIEISTTFSVLEAKTLPDIFAGQRGPERNQGACYLYGRSWSPTVHTLARQLAALEDTEAAYAVSSGMAAISSAVLALCDSGDHIVCSNVVYGGTFAYMKSFLPRKCGISVTFVDVTDLDAVRAAMRPNTKVVFTEVVSNPTLVVADLPALADISHAGGASLVVDNTFTPLAVTPTRWGADVVVHSMTKFISGASDVIAGAVCGSKALVAALMDLHTGPVMLQGPTMDPRIAAELLLRLPHLPVRMAEHSRRAAAMAQMLANLGARVVYPGLPSHPQAGLLSRLLNPGYGAGGLLGLDMGSPAKAEALMERLQNKHAFGLMAVSLGYSDTLMSLSAASTSSELSDADKAAAALSDGYVRFSVGITGTLEQRLGQLREAYEFVVGCEGRPPFRATKVQRLPTGELMELLSWPSGGPDEDGADEEGQHGAAGLLADPTAAALIGAAVACGSGSRLVVGGPGWRKPHGQEEAAPPLPAASLTGSLTAGGAAPSASGGSSSEDDELGAHARSALRALSKGRSRLGEGLDALGLPTKIRRLDDDTHVVYTPLRPAPHPDAP